MKDDDYNRVFGVISGRMMDMDKLDAAKQATTNAKCMTAQQISQILAVLNMEMHKLEYAKFAFPFCADQKNYGILNNHFMMDMSKKELGKLTGVN